MASNHLNKTDPLKEIAGRLQKLTYTEMVTFGEKLSAQLLKRNSVEKGDVIEALFATAEEIHPFGSEPVDKTVYRHFGTDTIVR